MGLGLKLWRRLHGLARARGVGDEHGLNQRVAPIGAIPELEEDLRKTVQRQEVQEDNHILLIRKTNEKKKREMRRWSREGRERQGEEWDLMEQDLRRQGRRVLGGESRVQPFQSA